MPELELPPQMARTVLNMPQAYRQSTQLIMQYHYEKAREGARRDATGMIISAYPLVQVIEAAQMALDKGFYPLQSDISDSIMRLRSILTYDAKAWQKRHKIVLTDEEAREAILFIHVLPPAIPSFESETL